MTFHQAKGLRPIRRSTLNRVSALGVALMLACAPALAAAPAEKPVGATVAPATAPAGLSVAKIDFKRGDDGAGRLIVQFDGQGAIPDLRTQGNSVVVDVGNARLPANLQKPMNVTDFATPVQRIDAKPSGAGTQLVLSTGGAVESLAYQSGNEYVVEISPRQAPAAVGAVTAGSVTQAAKAVGQRGFTGKPVTFNFQDVPVRTVLQLIAEESNLNVVASDSVQGNVTLRLVNVPWDQALDIVLRAKGLDKRRDGSVIWVAPQAELAKFEQEKEDARIAIENREDLVTDYVQINYHSATQIFKALTEAKGIGGSGSGGAGGSGSPSQEDSGFLSSRGRIVADERTNTLMISDIPKKIARMRELIGVIDRPVDQVLIESRIVIATDTFARELGAKFGISGSRDNVYFSGNLESNRLTRESQVKTAQDNAKAERDWIAGGRVGPPPVPTGSTITRGLNWSLPVATASNPGSLALSILNAGYLLDVELSAMQEESRGEVISNPRVVTTNQREALIKQGKEIGYVTISGGGAGGIATPNVQFKEVVLELKVTPTITNDNRVFLNMQVKKDEVDQLIQLDGYGTVPSINRREVNTAVLVEDGQTVVIGGVYEFTDRSSINKVPFLGDVPFLGNLFKKRGRNKDKAELLVFVTPKVLRVAKQN
ncbi:TPA: type IV pilus secretin PilQ family protein [Stenotrophomonas maltophilia]|uniref:Type IV pilus secretin PilQ family protein n=1 Tax=Stenotrophomonas riyadhensis TaxID=2859893 RepID=A0ABT2XK37_9GAMM|nr:MULTISPECIES: type IV pilus secretin PilQ family protein [unclassified Stenotrophomonas]MBH1618943.1 type IV pilus secretin PilQ family protein [Stenotrophomonas maltophilia]MCV0326284.1 type IV pilus secretin PilQ family protein [Stenotrophomonas sp. CFS3442]MDV9040459.1 type IV pilus secretin PilQ family protein [Stenotrophomonas sp. RAC2]HDS1129940.1 type IV pilus secretin PilQ family protein [Stenotrophomonas maltophilia]HDS1157168.1 type IV pilus secretin PilQ family protein [Stenotrop